MTFALVCCAYLLPVGALAVLLSFLLEPEDWNV